MERRSANRTAPRRRYTVDAFEGVEELQDVRSENEDPIGRLDDDDSAEEYEIAEHQNTAGAGTLEAESDIDVDTSDDQGEATTRRRKQTTSTSRKRGEPEDVTRTSAFKDVTSVGFTSRSKGSQPDNAVRTYTRGTIDAINRVSSGNPRRLYYFGPSADDYKPAHAARVQWAYEPTLPSRSADKHGFGGMHRSFFVDDSACEQQTRCFEDWWRSDDGGKAFIKRQLRMNATGEQIADYMPERDTDPLPGLMGPFNDQRIFSLPVGEGVSLKEAWVKGQQGSGALPSEAPSSYKAGFVLNLGSRIRCLDWAPTRVDQDQYLAVSVSSKWQHGYDQIEAPEAPAFTPQPATKANIQIWRFTAEVGGTINTGVPPQLSLVLSVDWGHARTLKWCPISCNLSASSSDRTRLGLLAGVWADGVVRVLHVTLPHRSGETTYVHLTRAAFESRPPGTVCTSLTWVSATRIAVGCANGCVAIWDLPAATKSSAANVRPTIYSSVSTSYILSIASCYPSRPNLVLTVSMSGYMSMTDLDLSDQSLCSHASTIFSNRSRIGQPLLLWHDFIQVAIHVDDSFTIRGSPVRRFFQTIGLGRCKSSATALAGSPCHPFILVGTAHGEVVATNPIKRVLDGKAGIWHQTWFDHEWRRPMKAEVPDPGVEEVDSDVQVPATNSYGPQSPTKSTPVCRMLEGFKAERIVLANDDRNSYNQIDGTFFATVFEEKSAITALAWNPNPHVGGWAAAGMGSGLLRVEDIAI